MLLFWLVLCLTNRGPWLLVQDADAFVACRTRSLQGRRAATTTTSTTSICRYGSSSSSSGSNDGIKRRRDESRKGTWTTKNDFRTFLNQCTVQSFLFLVRQMRDVQTVAWLEEFTQPTVLLRQSELERDQLENYQTGEFVEPSAKPNNDETATASEPVLSSKLLRYHGLGAMNTTRFPTWESYFLDLLQEKKEVWTIQSTKAHIPTYDLEINPPSLCGRMISVREQIAKEWAKDLGVIASMSRRVMESYFEKLRQQSDGGHPADGAIHIERQAIQDLLFLEWSPDEGSDLAPSPLRQGNFDLLVLMTTQEAIHRVLNKKEQIEAPSDAASCHFLETFYSERLPTHFIGGQRYGRSDEFLEELLSTPPSMITLDSERSAFIDPMRVTEMILTEREGVALEWQAISRGSPDEHFGIRRIMLNKLMGIDVSD
jgi:hypothetical protein